MHFEHSVPDRAERFVSWFLFLNILAVLATVFDRGGNSALAIRWAGYLAVPLLTLASLLWLRHVDQSQPAFNAWSLALAAQLTLALHALVVLLPVADHLWLKLPGRSKYESVASALAILGNDTSLSLTFSPSATTTSLLLLIVCIGVFIGTAMLSPQQRRWLVGLLLGIATFQIVLGMAQIALRGAPIVTPDYLGHVRASGSFVNKNHLATLLSMLLPFALFGLIASIQHIPRTASDRKPLRVAQWAILTTLLAIGIALTLSRAGMAAALAVTMLSLALHRASQKRRGSDRKKLLLYGLGFALATVVLIIASDRIVKAFGDPGAVGSLAARAQMTSATWMGALHFFPLGSGIGSFSVAFPAFQPPSLTGYIEHAHNEYAQLLFETGIFGVVFLLLASLCLFQLGQNAYRKIANPSLGHAALIGCIGFALHAWLDFPARIPALSFIFSALLAIACVELQAKSKQQADQLDPERAYLERGARDAPFFQSGESTSMNRHSIPKRRVI